MADFSVTPVSFNAGSLDPGEVVNIPVTFDGGATGATGEGTVTFDLSDGQSATLTISLAVEGDDVSQGAIVVDPALTGVTITVQNLTNAGANVRVARA